MINNPNQNDASKSSNKQQENVKPDAAKDSKTSEGNKTSNNSSAGSR